MNRLPAWLLVVLATATVWAAPQIRPLEYPLEPGTRWIYHLHQENGPGVTFGELLGSVAKGNVVDATVVAAVAGSDVVAGQEYTRIETTFKGKPFLIEWTRLAPDGLVYGKTIDYQQSPDPILIQPEQRRLSTDLRPGHFWYWQSGDGVVRTRYNVVGASQTEVPAGRYQGTHFSSDSTVRAGIGPVTVHQETWFAPRVGIVRQETHVALKSRDLSQVTLTLEQFESHHTP